MCLQGSWMEQHRQKGVEAAGEKGLKSSGFQSMLRK